MQFLVGEDQYQMVFAGAGEDSGHGGRDEVMELVDIEVEISPLGRLDLLPAHGELAELGDQKRAKQVSVFFADGALGELAKKDFPLAHTRGNAEPVLRLADQVPDELRSQA